jgi:hypothetical protein
VFTVLAYIWFFVLWGVVAWYGYRVWRSYVKLFAAVKKELNWKC